MASFFDALWAAAQPAFDGAMGEPIRIEPETLTRRARVVADLPDPNLAPFEAIGIFRGQTVVDRTTTRPGTTENVETVSQAVTADFVTSQFTDATTPRKGWNLVLVSRPGAPRYAIQDARPDMVARVVCDLAFKENTA
jgi:hypothetical protein